MKTVLLLSVCLVAVSTTSIFQLRRSSTHVTDSVGACLANKHNIDPAVLQLEDDKNFDLYDKLSEEQKGCVTSCVYKAFNWTRADGSLDIDTLTDGDTPEEKKKYEEVVAACKTEVGDNECKFFECLDKKDE